MNSFKAVLAGLAALFFCMSAQAEVVDRIVAVVNDEIITLSELNTAFEPYQARLEAASAGREREKALSESKATLLKRMIDNLLMEQQSRKVGITVRDEDVSNAIKDMLARRKLSQENFLKALEQEGSSLEAYRKGIRDQLVRLRLIQRELKSKTAANDEEIGAYYQKNREDYEGKEAVRIKQILLLLPKEEDPEGMEKLRANAGAIHKRLLNGESFDSLSAQFSQGPDAASGGDTGYIEKGTILPEVENVAFSLPINQISGVIESSVGLHIIQVIDRRGAGLKAIESVRDEIREKIEMEKMEKMYEEWLDALRKKSHIEIKL